MCVSLNTCMRVCDFNLTRIPFWLACPVNITMGLHEHPANIFLPWLKDFVVGVRFQPNFNHDMGNCGTGFRGCRIRSEDHIDLWYAEVFHVEISITMGTTWKCNFTEDPFNHHENSAGLPDVFLDRTYPFTMVT